MIGFEVRINNQEPIVIGADNVSFVILSYGDRFSEKIYLGGGDCRSHYTWLAQKSVNGDKVVIKVVEIDRVSPVQSTRDWDRNEMKARYENFKAELLKKGLI